MRWLTESYKIGDYSNIHFKDQQIKSKLNDSSQTALETICTELKEC